MTDNGDIFSSAGYVRSRKAYIVQCAFDYFVAILVSDAFLAKLLKDMGISDSAVGIISSLISVSFLFQLLSVPFVDRIKRLRRTVIGFDTASQMLFMLLFLVPFTPFGVKTKTAVVTVIMLLAYFCLYMISALAYRWGNSFVEPMKRGSYSAGKEMFSLISGVVFTLAVGFVIDRFEAAGQLHTAFIFISCSIFVLSVCNFTAFMRFEDRRDLTGGEKHSAKDILKNTLGNRRFVNEIILLSLFDIARYFTVGFMGTYKTVELGFTVGAIQVINTAACLIRFGISKPLGKYADRTSFAKGYFLALCLAAAGFFVNIFSTPSSKWCMIAFTLLYNMSHAGTSENSFGMTYSFVDAPYITHALAICNSIRGAAGFAASLPAGKLLAKIQKNGNVFLGRKMYGQQALSAITFVLLVVAAAFDKLVVEKQKAEKK